MTLRDNHWHSRHLDICQVWRRGAKILQLAEARNKGREPDSQLGLPICPALIRILGLEIDRDGLATGLVHGDVIPALDFRTREGLKLEVGRGDLGIWLEDKREINYAFREGAASCDLCEVFRVDGNVLTI